MKKINVRKSTCFVKGLLRKAAEYIRYGALWLVYVGGFLLYCKITGYNYLEGHPEGH